MKMTANSLFLEYDKDAKYSFIEEKRQLLPYEFCKNRHFLPLEEENEKILVACSAPVDLNSVQQTKLILKKDLLLVITPTEEIERLISICYQTKISLSEKFSTNEKSLHYDLLASNSSVPVIRFLDNVLASAIQDNASDIHFLPSENGLIIKFRVNGILQNRYTPPKEYQSHLITRIKVISNLDISESRMPQDGRIKLAMGNREIDFRISTLPTIYGERLVLRILDKNSLNLGLSNIGMPDDMISSFKKLIKRPEGIILVTGPTGSGKTTTLYSALTEIDTNLRNIITIEDPVEYKLSNISQINVNSKIDLTFSVGLRHILRQDPDVILVGEIRDKETAFTAIQASLTGHLVFSTLHTNDAPSAILRMMDMGIESYLISSTLVAVLAQRLVCTICPNCKISYTPTESELSELGLDGKYIFYKGTKCEKCFYSGYQGRTAIYELLVLNKEIKSMISEKVDVTEIRKQSKMKSLRQQGVDLILQGITTTDEVLRMSITQE